MTTTVERAAKQVAQQVSAGLLTPNEARERFSLPPLSASYGLSDFFEDSGPDGYRRERELFKRKIRIENAGLDRRTREIVYDLYAKDDVAAERGWCCIAEPVDGDFTRLRVLVVDPKVQFAV